MACLIELILSKPKQQFPSYKIIDQRLTVTRETQPVFTAGSAFPMFRVPGRRRMDLSLTLSQLTASEFDYINNKITSGEPVEVLLNDIGDYQRATAIGIITSATNAYSRRYSYEISLDMDITGLRVCEEGRRREVLDRAV